MPKASPNILSGSIASPATSPAPDATHKRLTLLEDKVAALLAEMDRGLPVWVRAPVSGPEHYTGFSRSKLYELAASGAIRSTSIREPGQLKGTRLFHLASILAFIEKNEVAAAEGGAK